jgi:hypothetical protein
MSTRKRKRNNRPNNTPQGLHIGPLTVSKISGPVSYLYLRPSRLAYAAGYQFPLMLLFGDVHQSADRLCTDDGMKLSDPALLAALDRLSTPESPIDFYVETTLKGADYMFESPLNDFASGPIVSCYHHRIKGTPLNQCPTKNIRWHVIDARHASATVFPTINHNEHTRSLYANPAFTAPIEHTQFMKGTSVEPQLRAVFYASYLRPSRWGPFANAEEYIAFFHQLTEDVDLPNDDPTKYKRFAEGILHLLETKPSIIAKQIRKQPLPILRKFSTWAEYYRRILVLYLRMFPAVIKRYSEYMATFKHTLPHVKPLPLAPTDITLFKNLMITVTGALQDIYMISRMWKTPTDGTPPALCIAYTGTLHAEMVARLLMQIGFYEIVQHRLVDKEYNRCISMEYLPLHNELHNHKLKLELGRASASANITALSHLKVNTRSRRNTSYNRSDKAR